MTEKMPYRAGGVSDHNPKNPNTHALEYSQKAIDSPYYKTLSPDKQGLLVKEAMRKADIVFSIHSSADSLLKEIHRTKSTGNHHFGGDTYLDFATQGRSDLHTPRGGIVIHDAMEVDGVTSLTLESWSNKTLVLIQKDGTVSFDGKIVDKAFLATLPKNEQDPYKEILRLANYVNSKKAYPENDAKRFAEFRKVFYK